MNSIWHYKGPVFRFGRCVCPEYDVYTTAPSEGRALCNIQSRFKAENGYEQSARIELDHVFIQEEEIS